MIPVTPVPEPSSFDERVRNRGRIWLEQHGTKKRPPPYWKEFRHVLADGCYDRCAYSAMLTTVGSVDHFRSYKTHPELAYEWTNYRYADSWINSVKKERDVLDPHNVGEGWFEVLLPSMQLVATTKVPIEYHTIVKQTLKHLRLGHDEEIVRLRRTWYDLYRQQKLTLEGLRKVAPLIAAAVEKQFTTK